MSYALIVSAPAVHVPDVSQWLDTSAHTVVRADRSVLNSNNFYRDGGTADHHVLFRQYQTQAHAGQADAQYKMGLAYEYGLGVIQDAQMALYWYEQSAANDFGEAKVRLAYAHYDGSLNLQANRMKAQDWFEKAGVAEAMPFRLSQMH